MRSQALALYSPHKKYSAPLIFDSYAARAEVASDLMGSVPGEGANEQVVYLYQVKFPSCTRQHGFVKMGYQKKAQKQIRHYFTSANKVHFCSSVDI